MLEKLTQLWGVSGQEEEVAAFIIKNAADNVDEIKQDAVGNLFLLKRGCGTEKKKIMVSAHMDEIGLCVVRILDNGLLKVKQIGGLSAFVIYMNRVRFKNGITGVIACDRNIQDIKDADIRELYVDIGVSSREDAEKYVKVGDCAVIQGEFEHAAGDCVLAKAFDDRVACSILMETIKEMQTPYHDIYFTFTVQEEVGLRGATVAAERIQPDLGIAVDITRSFDLPGEDYGNPVLGKGVAIKVSDGSVLCDHEWTCKLRDIAEENGIPFQMDALYAGGTDIGAIMKSGKGVKTLGLSIPTRYGHTPNNMIHKKDIAACKELLKVFLEKEIKIETEKTWK